MKNADCEECQKVYELHHEDPPCEECPKPKDLFVESRLSWTLWCLCSGFSRGLSMSELAPINIDTALKLVEAYDGTVRDFESILLIESIALPILREKKN